MKWETSQLKVAILAAPEHINKTEAEKDTLKETIDEGIQSMTPDQRNLLQPESLLHQVVGIEWDTNLTTLPYPTKAHLSGREWL